MKTKNYITTEGFKKLQEEYHLLHSVERPKLVETVAWAASNGDRSENADYIYGKRRLREIDSRMRFLNSRLEAAVVVDPQSISTQTVVFGCSVKLEDEDGQITSYQIVGEDESQPEVGRISWTSPIAKAVLGKRVGDEAKVQRPVGEIIYTVLAITKPLSEKPF